MRRGDVRRGVVHNNGLSRHNGSDSAEQVAQWVVRIWLKTGGYLSRPRNRCIGFEQGREAGSKSEGLAPGDTIITVAITLENAQLRMSLSDDFLSVGGSVLTLHNRAKWGKRRR